MEFRSVGDLAEDVRHLATDVFGDVDLIVAVPRSGLLAGNLLALYLNVPLTDVDGFRDERLLDTGRRFDGANDFEAVERVLVIDDSAYSGTQMRAVQSNLHPLEDRFDIEYAAVYVTPNGSRFVDHWCEVIGRERMFEWNVLHHERLADTCVDIDGVLCRDPRPEENDDGDAYREFLTGVEPKVLPTKEVGWLVTCRLEKYREETERWLDEHGIRYGELRMMDLPDMETRRRLGTHAAFKAAAYESTGADLFIESSPAQASEIAERTGKPVLCFEDFRLIDPSLPAKNRRRANRLVTGGPAFVRRTASKYLEYLARFVRNPPQFSRAATRHVRRRLSLAKTRWILFVRRCLRLD